MKPRELQELIEFINQTGLEEVKIETDKFKVSVKRSAENSIVAAQPIQQYTQQVAPPVQQATPQQTQAPVATPQTETKKEEATPAADTGNYVTVKSPMIGTFYRSENPEAAPFVNVGDSIKEGATICIIEAMKLFNEIESDVSGKIVKVLVENATPVEYDQPLFLIEPN
ncbi:acetyl-CoA carboxylase biotin carboxyl carrier protein [Bernardetia sp.]|uniref:acetyl-CoA carboxylase biotin carboxyl carrier protein n=1 Tax=Bernardetia sp. TaxID=1937974 RepID=UPI0025BFB565|nr:acetyl-CoA carboxylase biotin carboxyl carrier protein [Bernardetia sp.]